MDNRPTMDPNPNKRMTSDEVGILIEVFNTLDADPHSTPTQFLDAMHSRTGGKRSLSGYNQVLTTLSRLKDTLSNNHLRTDIRRAVSADESVKRADAKRRALAAAGGAPKTEELQEDLPLRGDVKPDSYTVPKALILEPIVPEQPPAPQCPWKNVTATGNRVHGIATIRVVELAHSTIFDISVARIQAMVDAGDLPVLRRGSREGDDEVPVAVLVCIRNHWKPNLSVEQIVQDAQFAIRATMTEIRRRVPETDPSKVRQDPVAEDIAEVVSPSITGLKRSTDFDVPCQPRARETPPAPPPQLIRGEFDQELLTGIFGDVASKAISVADASALLQATPTQERFLHALARGGTTVSACLRSFAL